MTLWPYGHNKTNEQRAFDEQIRAKKAAPPSRASGNVWQCPVCGGDKTETGYGLAFGDGIGVYVTCAGCGELISKTPDNEVSK